MRRTAIFWWGPEQSGGWVETHYTLTWRELLAIGWAHVARHFAGGCLADHLPPDVEDLICGLAPASRYTRGRPVAAEDA